MRAALRFAALVCFAGSLPACVDHLGSPTYGIVTTLELELLSPSPGSASAPNMERNAMINLTAKDEFGDPYGGDAMIDIYVSYEGVRTGLPVECGDDSDAPIESIMIHGGTLTNHSLALPVAYGETSIWAVERSSHVIGASTPIFYPNPTIPNIQTPPDPTSMDATYCTAFNGKFITVDHATGNGELLVDSVFGNAITVTDTGATDFRSMYVFVFSAPDARLIPGTHVTSFNGNISKFVGFTELNFPVIEADYTAPNDAAKLPAPIVLTIADRANNTQKLNAANSAVVEVTAAVCPVNIPNPNHNTTIQATNDQWTKYSTFNFADPKVGCDDSFSTYSVALPSKVVGDFDPTMEVAQIYTIKGMLKNSSGQNPLLDDNGNTIACDATHACAGGTCSLGICKKGAFNFWTIQVRDKNDISK